MANFLKKTGFERRSSKVNVSFITQATLGSGKMYGTFSAHSVSCTVHDDKSFCFIRSKMTWLS